MAVATLKRVPTVGSSKQSAFSNNNVWYNKGVHDSSKQSVSKTTVSGIACHYSYLKLLITIVPGCTSRLSQAHSTSP
jgi:hypothetical protein